MAKYVRLVGILVNSYPARQNHAKSNDRWYGPTERCPNNGGCFQISVETSLETSGIDWQALMLVHGPAPHQKGNPHENSPKCLVQPSKHHCFSEFNHIQLPKITFCWVNSTFFPWTQRGEKQVRGGSLMWWGSPELVAQEPAGALPLRHLGHGKGRCLGTKID